MSVLVVGGGVGGLVAAYDLGRAGIPVTLVEASERLGGKIGTERVAGCLVERGPDSFLATGPDFLDLCRELGLGDDLMLPSEPAGTSVWHPSRGLVPLPAGAGSGLPRSLRPLLATPLFSPREKLRIVAELVVPAHPAADDESVGALLRRRFGNAFVARLAAPLYEGLYGAPIDELSAASLAPRLREAERRHGSLLRAGRAARRSGAPAAGAPLLSLRAGLGSLVDALAARLGAATVRLGAPAERIAREAGGYAVTLAGGERLRGDALVVALPAPAAAATLAEGLPELSRALAALPHGSTASVYLAYRADDVGAPLVGHGFLSPPGALPFSACSYISSKWAGRATPGTVLLRTSVRRPELVAAADDTLATAVHAALAPILRLAARPVMAHVARHRGVMPRYTVGHAARLAAVEAAAGDADAFALIGAAYRGVGVPECAAQGRRAARRIADELGRRAGLR